MKALVCKNDFPFRLQCIKDDSEDQCKLINLGIETFCEMNHIRIVLQRPFLIESGTIYIFILGYTPKFRFYRDMHFGLDANVRLHDGTEEEFFVCSDDVVAQLIFQTIGKPWPFENKVMKKNANHPKSKGRRRILKYFRKKISKMSTKSEQQMEYGFSKPIEVSNSMNNAPRSISKNGMNF